MLSEGEKNYIRNLMRTLDYDKAIEKIDYYLSKTIDETDYWFLISNRSLSCKKDGRLDEAMEYAVMSKKYTTPPIEGDNYLDPNYFIAHWLISTCFDSLGMKNQAIETYKECLILLEGKNHVEGFKICIKFNIAKIQQNEIQMKTLLNKYIETDDYNERNLKEMYEELIDVYIIKNQKDKIFLLINSIKNQEIKFEITKNIKKKIVA